MWEIGSTETFDDWLAALNENARNEAIAKINLLQVYGPRLPRPHADTLNGSKHANMKELRVDTVDQVIRIAFAFDPERRGILLVAGNKAVVGQRNFYRRLIEKADELFDIHLSILRLHRNKKGKSDG